MDETLTVLEIHRDEPFKPLGNWRASRGTTVAHYFHEEHSLCGRWKKAAAAWVVLNPSEAACQKCLEKLRAAMKRGAAATRKEEKTG